MFPGILTLRIVFTGVLTIRIVVPSVLTKDRGSWHFNNKDRDREFHYASTLQDGGLCFDTMLIGFSLDPSLCTPKAVL